jgi:hypothetical protein
LASKKKSIKAKKKSTGFDLTPFVIVVGILGIVLTICIGYRAAISDRKLFSVSLIALFGGLLFESFRIADNWKNVVYQFIGTYFFSLLCFLPGKNERNYNLENHIKFWPYYFLFFFALYFAIFNKDKVTAKLTEGVTLLLSISIIYWSIDYGFVNYHNWFTITLVAIAFIFCAFSILNALTTIQLTKTVRLTLSIWSSIIMFAFAIDNIIRVFKSQDIESTEHLSQGIYIGLQYFLLGVSAVYIMQNFILLTGFLPSKNGNYRRDLQENKKAHINRFSDKQVLVGHSLFCILYASTFYVLNYKYQILPRHTMIWLVFFTFPITLYFVNLIIGQKTIASRQA